MWMATNDSIPIDINWLQIFRRFPGEFIQGHPQFQLGPSGLPQQDSAGTKRSNGSNGSTAEAKSWGHGSELGSLK